MRNQPFFRLFPLLMLITALLIAGCSVPVASQPAPVNQSAPDTQSEPETQVEPVNQAAPETQAAPEIQAATDQPAASPTDAPTEPAPAEPGGTADPEFYTDLEPFKAALLRAMMDQDAEKLRRWMASPFLTGGWRADGSDAGPDDALRELYTHYLGTKNRLEVVKDADLKALMGGNDPLSFPRQEAGVIEAVLVSGWGKDGRDEAILFIAREADNNLKWQGWMIIQGGFSGADLGGIQPYNDEENGYSFFVPKGFVIQESNASSVVIMAPGEGHPGQDRAAAFINVEPANGRTVEQITEQVKADLGPDFHIAPGTAMGLDKAFAIVLYGLPGQDSNRQLFVVYNDLLYHITFVPDAPQVGKYYFQMEDLYAMIVNTFHFTN